MTFMADTWRQCFWGQCSASIVAVHKAQLHWDKSFPLMRRLFDAIGTPAVSYGCELWSTMCFGRSFATVEQDGALQLAVILLGFMHRLAKMSKVSLHADILRDYIQDTDHSPL